MKTLSLRSMSRRAKVHLWVFIIAAIAGPLFYLESPKLWSFALLSWALVCATPIAVVCCAGDHRLWSYWNGVRLIRSGGGRCGVGE